MRKFVFCDKSKVEMNIITDVLYDEKIPYKLETKEVKHFCFCDDEEEDDFVFVEEMYNIHCFTDLEHFDFVKHIAYKKINQRIYLERCALKKVSKKNVQRVSKKNTTNTHSKHRSKPKE